MWKTKHGIKIRAMWRPMQWPYSQVFTFSVLWCKMESWELSVWWRRRLQAKKYEWEFAHNGHHPFCHSFSASLSDFLCVFLSINSPSQSIHNANNVDNMISPNPTHIYSKTIEYDSRSTFQWNSRCLLP